MSILFIICFCRLPNGDAAIQESLTLCIQFCHAVGLCTKSMRQRLATLRKPRTVAAIAGPWNCFPSPSTAGELTVEPYRLSIVAS